MTLRIATHATVNDAVAVVQAWEEAKLAELNANRRRLEIEQTMQELFSAPDEGQKTHRVSGTIKVVRKNGISITGDIEKVLELSRELELAPLTVPKVSESACKTLRKQDPTSFALLLDEQALVVRPAKPSFEVSHVVG